MEAVAVLDIKHGIVVQGRAGDRENYQPIESRLIAADDKSPLAVAKAFYNKLAIKKLYIADLDAIMKKDEANIDEIKAIKKELPQVEIMLDAALLDFKTAQKYLDDFLDYYIIATESLNDLKYLAKFSDYSKKVIISIDLKNGELINNLEQWQDKTTRQIIEEIKGYGFKKFIILDIAAVGTARGIAAYIKELKNLFPELEFITGGGVKDYRDIKPLKKQGFSGVLIATAFHNGSLGRKEVELIENEKILFKIAWCITGAGHLLAESIEEIANLKNKYNNLEIDIYLSKAGFEVLKIYKLFNKLEELGCEIQKDSAASSPIMGRLYKGHYDLLVSSPTTSNTVAKFVHGISDTLVSNFLAHAGKSKIPILLLPTDTEEELVSAAPNKMVDVYPREIDIKNTDRLKGIDKLEIISDLEEVEQWLKNYL
ncbi:histidine biosynthesis protein [Halanaerobium hydrogeniformans]|uniref:Histidine biosynthesis protein n=1 Tax=Halanaerobium hydrogeniformans TaxID=656519 RepID=E4RM50_HALHG|nr:histidine biosynthesis protein [Halanaerobium hydrogeniformans]